MVRSIEPRERVKYEEMEHDTEILFFKERIEVDKVLTGSAQAVIFFGTEVNMRMRVVLKQYRGETFEEILREIRLFTLLEKKKLQIDIPQWNDMSEILICDKQLDGLPELLGYKI